MAWIESHQAIQNHPKLYLLMDLLETNKPQTIGHLHLLWWWCIDYAPSGELTGFSQNQISRACEWLQDSEKFINGLKKAGWLDTRSDRLFVHDWKDFCGRLIEKRLERNKKLRISRGAHVPPMSRPCSAQNGPCDALPTNLTNQTNSNQPTRLSASGSQVYDVIKNCARIKIKNPAVIESWLSAFPRVDLKQEILKAEAWANSKDVTRTPRGWQTTLNSWFQRVAADTPKDPALIEGTKEYWDAVMDKRRKATDARIAEMK